MKVLWFSVTPSQYSDINNRQVRGGWIESLESIVRKHADVELGIAFLQNNSKPGWSEVVNENGVYYPISLGKLGFLKRLKAKFTYKDVDVIILKSCGEIIQKYNPDIIQVFGAEWCFGLVKQSTNIPVVIHIQGSIPVCRNERYIPGTSLFTVIWSNLKRPKVAFKILCDEVLWKEREVREERIMTMNKYFMGRTKWDKALVRLYSPKGKYFYCSEALRTSILDNGGKWHKPHHKKQTIISIGDGNMLKGYDTILKTAKIIKQLSDVDFVWYLLGPSRGQINMFENITKIKACDVCIDTKGSVRAEQVTVYLLDADLYVHASYIDNSSNAICEAQYIGLPIVATNVGGTSSLFSIDYPSELLVHPNDPWYMASTIIELLRNEEMQETASRENKSIALERHNPQNIYKSLMDCYNTIISDNESHS